jgi:hypothetical protein
LLDCDGMLLFSLCVLIRQLVQPLVETYVTHRGLSDFEAKLIGTGCVMLMLPVTYLRSLNSLRHVSLCQVGCVVFLVFLLCLKGLACFKRGFEPHAPGLPPYSPPLPPISPLSPPHPPFPPASPWRVSNLRATTADRAATAAAALTLKALGFYEHAGFIESGSVSGGSALVLRRAR